MNKTNGIDLLTLAPGAPVAPRAPRPPRDPCGESDTVVNQLHSTQLDLTQCYFRIIRNSAQLPKSNRGVIARLARVMTTFGRCNWFSLSAFCCSVTLVRRALATDASTSATVTLYYH